MDGMSEWILSCLGCCRADMELVNNYYEEFECNFLDDEEDMKQEIKIALDCNGLLCNMILHGIFEDVISRAERLGADRDRFDYYINALDSSITYDGEEFSSWKELDEIINKKED